MTAKAGALAALGSSALWAYGSAKYAQESRVIGSSAVNLTRALIVLPIFALAVVVMPGSGFSSLTGAKIAWLLVSVLCSYAFADNVFFGAARAIGISTALAIASLYPLWSTAVGVLLGGEHFGILRMFGTAACVGGVIALIRLAPRHGEVKRAHVTRGIVLALATSFLWAGNTITVRLGSVGLDAWHSNFLRFLLALPILFVSTRRFAGPEPILASGSAKRLLAPSVFEACLGSSLFVFALSHTDLSIGATLSSLAPLISVPVAIAIGEERWNAPRFAAVSVTVVGVILLVIGA